tara:strand:- start:3 stop:302 length:300 start_codon:yes stop_codon:yes gene_type:complete
VFIVASFLVVVNVPVPLPTATSVAFANTFVDPILNPLAVTVAFPFELIVADTVKVAAELDVEAVDVNDKSENKGTVVLNPLVAGCTAVVDIIIFCPALV